MIGCFRSALCVSVVQGSLLLIVIMIDGSKKKNSCESGFGELYEKCSKWQTEPLFLKFNLRQDTFLSSQRTKYSVTKPLQNNIKCLFGKDIHKVLITILNNYMLLTNIQSRWLDIGQALFLWGQYQAILTEQAWSIYCIEKKRTFTCGNNTGFPEPIRM